MYIINPNEHSDREVAKILDQCDPDIPVAVALKKPETIELFQRFNPFFMVEKYTDNITTEFCDEQIEKGMLIIKPEMYRKARVKNLPELDIHRLPHELVKVSLELMSKSLKESLRIGSMALICEIVQSGDKILCVGGRENLLDTAVVLIPGFASDFVDAKVLEIICAPYDQ